jgi:hypothetical protein
MVPLSAETKPQATRGKNNMNKDQARSTFEAVYNSLKKTKQYDSTSINEPYNLKRKC